MLSHSSVSAATKIGRLSSSLMCPASDIGVDLCEIVHFLGNSCVKYEIADISDLVSNAAAACRSGHRPGSGGPLTVTMRFVVFAICIFGNHRKTLMTS